MAKVYGNRGPYYYGGKQGFGRENDISIGSWVVVSGVADDVVYLSVNDLSNYTMQMGCYVQATAAVTIEYSLQNPTIACDRNNQSTVYWGNSQTLTASAITECSSILFTAVKITFTNAADVFFYTR